MNHKRPDLQPMTKRFPQAAEHDTRKSGGSQSFLWVPQISHFSFNLQELNDEN